MRREISQDKIPQTAIRKILQILPPQIRQVLAKCARPTLNFKI